MPSIPSITIGRYTIGSFMNYKGEWAISIRTYGGEGMETSIKELESVIEKFYNERF
jgi:hypothetical protein